MLSIYRQITWIIPCSNNIFRGMSAGLYEPPYLESMKSKIPLHNDLNIQFKGYDYPVLENYQKFVHKLLKGFEINVEEGWGAPAAHSHILRYKPKSSVIDSEYKLKLFERNIQITDVTATQYPILIRILETSLPEGVSLNVHDHAEFDEEIRYVPDKELLQLKSQLEDIASTKKK